MYSTPQIIPANDNGIAFWGCKKPKSNDEDNKPAPTPHLVAQRCNTIPLNRNSSVTGANRSKSNLAAFPGTVSKNPESMVQYRVSQKLQED